MTTTDDQQATLVSELMELLDAASQHGQAVARGDQAHAAKAYRAALSALERILIRVDPGLVDQGRALLIRTLGILGSVR